MKNTHFFLVTILFIITSCGHGVNNTPDATSAFSFRGNSASTIKIGTQDTCSAISKSTNAESILWDFGDGRTSKDQTITLSYPKSGTYILKLIAKGFDGEKTESSKKVIVLDRILKKIVIDRVQWDTAVVSQGWPTIDVADIYFQIQLFTNTTMNPKGIYPQCPVLFTSSIIKSINSNHIPPIYQPIEIPVSEKFIIDKNFLSETFNLAKINNLYLFSVMAKDASGKSYCLINNVWYDIKLKIQGDIASNSFSVETNNQTSFRLICDYE